MQVTASQAPTLSETVIGEIQTQINCRPTTVATSMTDDYHPQINTLNHRQRSRSPICESVETNPALRGTASDETCITFRPESNTENENVDEEMEVIPLSPQPARRRRFKMFPRLYSQTQYPSQGRVLQENSDCEL